ncbi:hypothetical protein G6F43_003974 [Rhizopus delemar]|nr:hypothetical protein G6F43_003974 [Rhizopus delemar]
MSAESSTSLLRKKRKFTSKFLDTEITALKAKVREAYSILAKKEEGYIPDERELNIIEEKDINDRMIKKLESMKESVHTYKAGMYFPEESFFSVLHLFYLVRLAQQGYFSVISHKYPALEPLAVRYICDKLVTSSLYTDKTADKEIKSAHRKEIFEVIELLRKGADLPVGPGFKTTYKYIAEIIQDLIKQTLLQHGNYEVKPQDMPATPPQVWIMMPYTSMIDNSCLYPFSMPSMAPGGFMGPVPFTTKTEAAPLINQENVPEEPQPIPDEIVPDTAGPDANMPDTNITDTTTPDSTAPVVTTSTQEQASLTPSIESESEVKEKKTSKFGRTKPITTKLQQSTGGMFKKSYSNSSKKHVFNFDDNDVFADADTKLVNPTSDSPGVLNSKNIQSDKDNGEQLVKSDKDTVKDTPKEAPLKEDPIKESSIEKTPANGDVVKEDKSNGNVKEDIVNGSADEDGKADTWDEKEPSATSQDDSWKKGNWEEASDQKPISEANKTWAEDMPDKNEDVGTLKQDVNDKGWPKDERGNNKWKRNKRDSRYTKKDQGKKQERSPESNTKNISGEEKANSSWQSFKTGN